MDSLTLVLTAVHTWLRSSDKIVGVIWVGLVLSRQVFQHSKTSSAKGLQSDVEQVDEEELRVGEEAGQCQQGWEQVDALRTSHSWVTKGHPSGSAAAPLFLALDKAVVLISR